MGMSIDKTIEFFNGLKGYTPQANDARDVAVDIMHKYQKIKEIYDNWNVDFGVKTHRAMIKIGEVLKDGNDDR